MRRIAVLLLIFVFSECNVTKIRKRIIQKSINNQDFNIITPENWRPFIRDHQNVAYTPLKKEDKRHNLVYFFKYPFKEELSFKEFALSYIKKDNELLDISFQETLSFKKSRLGSIYTHVNESKSQTGKNYKSYTVYFKHNGYYYYYNYSSLKNIYDIHFDEAINILNSITFK